MAKKWFALSDTKSNCAELSIFDEIGGYGVTVSDFAEQFKSIKDASSIHLYINSPGGTLTDGMAIYNILSQVRDKLTVEIIGVAASIASVVALAGKELIMNEGTYLMIHQAWTVSMGNSEDLRKDASTMDKMNGELVNLYTSHSNLSIEEITNMMAEETWLTADEALKFGFATSVNKQTKAVALAFPLENKGFAKVPRCLIREQLTIKDMNIREYEEVLRDTGFSKAEATRLASCGFPKDEKGEPSPSEEIEILKAWLNRIK